MCNITENTCANCIYARWTDKKQTTGSCFHLPGNNWMPVGILKHSKGCRKFIKKNSNA